MKPGSLAFAVFVAAWCVVLLTATLTSGPTQRVAPLVVIVPTLALAVLEVVRTARAGDAGPRDTLPTGRAPRLWGWGGWLLGLVWLLGFLSAVPVFLAPYLRIELGLGWARALTIAGAAAAGFTIVFGVLVRAPFPPGVLLG